MGLTHKKIDNPNQELYEHDFYGWTQSQVKALEKACRTGDAQDVDFRNILEEIGALGRSEYSAMDNVVANTIRHLLALHLFPQSDACSKWYHEIRVFRQKILRTLRLNPSLKVHLDDPNFLQEAWEASREDFIQNFGNQDDELERKFDALLPETPIWQNAEIYGFHHMQRRDQLPRLKELPRSLPDALFDRLATSNQTLKLHSRYSELPTSSAD